MPTEHEKVLEKVIQLGKIGMNLLSEEGKKNRLETQQALQYALEVIKKMKQIRQKLEGKKSVEHDEDGEACGCKYLEDDTPCGIKNQAIQSCIDEFKEGENDK